jgi:restriction system protein
MADVTIQRTGELLQKLFDILLKRHDGMRAQDALAELRASVELTEYEQGEYSSGSPRFEKIVRFATVDCVKAGWLIKDKGIWSVTDSGKKAYQELKSPEEFYRTAQRLYRQWKKSNKIAKETTVEEEALESSSAIITFEEAEEQAWNEIDDFLSNIPPYEFQKLVASLLKAMGYHVSWIAPAGKDGGVDILAWNDPLGTRPPRIKVQVKREQKAVNVSTLRSFLALLGDTDVGIFVNTSGFTRDAEDEARTQQSRQLTLIDSKRLFELWVEHMDKMDQSAKELFPLKPIYFLAPES